MTAAAGAQGADTSRGVPPRVAATEPIAKAPSKPERAPAPEYAGPRGARMATPRASDAGRATSMADRPPQKSLTKAERPSAIEAIMRLPEGREQDAFE